MTRLEGRPLQTQNQQLTTPLSESRAVASLILVHLAVYVVQLLSWGRLTTYLAMEPVAAFLHLQIWRPFTAVFCIAPTQVVDLLISVLVLRYVGTRASHVVGGSRVARCYICGGALTLAIWSLIACLMSGSSGVYGASSAVAALVCLPVGWEPSLQVVLLGYRVRAWMIAVGLVAFDFIVSISTLLEGGRATMGLLTLGALFGFAYGTILRRNVYDVGSRLP